MLLFLLIFPVMQARDTRNVFVEGEFIGQDIPVIVEFLGSLWNLLWQYLLEHTIKPVKPVLPGITLLFTQKVLMGSRPSIRLKISYGTRSVPMISPLP